PPHPGAPPQKKRCPLQIPARHSPPVYGGHQAAPRPFPTSPPPLPTTPDAAEFLFTPPPPTARASPSPPLLYENCNRYTLSGRTAPARKSRVFSSPKNFSTSSFKPRTALRQCYDPAPNADH